MKWGVRQVLCCCLWIVFLILNTRIPSLRASPGSIPKIFILHSYEAGNVCGQPQHDGVVAALQEAGYIQGHNIQFTVYYMDTKCKNNTPELIRKQAQMALDRIRSTHPSVLVTLDDNAFRTVALKLVDSPLPIVFSGMNGQPENYNQKVRFMESRGHPGHNITGVYEKLHIADAFRVHCRLFGEVRKIRIILDTSPTGKAIYRQVNLELAKESVPCTWDVKIARSWEDYQREIKRANNISEIGAIYPVAILLKNGSGKTYTAPEIFAWTIKNSRKPEIAVNYAFTRLGLFGGAAVDFFAMGRQAGKMVEEILGGRSPGIIPIEDARKYALVFNLVRARQLGIELPAEVILAADEIITKVPVNK